MSVVDAFVVFRGKELTEIDSSDDEEELCTDDVWQTADLASVVSFVAESQTF